ncbi:MAG TPA: hypothetical protein VH593_10515 [Ktedonobacteraceae bacterium]
MNNMYNEGQDQHATQGKVVLSGSSGGIVQSQSVNDQTSFMPAGNLQSPFPPGGAQPFAPGGPGAFPPVQPGKGLFQKVRTNPAYLVLAVAIVVVVIASGTLVAFAATGMGSNPNNHHANQPQAKVQATTTTRSTQGPAHTTAPKQTLTPVPTQASTPTQQQPTQTPPNPGSNPPPDPGGSASQTSSGDVPVQFVNLPQTIYIDSTGFTWINVKTQPGYWVTLTSTYPDGNTNVEDSGLADGGAITLLWDPQAYYLEAYPPPVSIVLTATVSQNLDGSGATGQVQATVQVIKLQN